MKQSLICLLGLMISLSSKAQLRLGSPEMSGLGCPAGSASTILSPDLSTLSVLFDQFVVEAGEGNGRDSAMKNCVLRVPVEVQNGFRVALVQADYRGFVSVPAQPAWADLIVQYGWLENYLKPGFKSELYFDGFNILGPKEEAYFHSTPIQVRDAQGRRTGPLWSRCGVQSLHFELGAKLRVHMQGAQGHALASIDSVDSSALDPGLQFQLRVEPCQVAPPPPPCRGRRCR